MIPQKCAAVFGKDHAQTKTWRWPAASAVQDWKGIAMNKLLLGLALVALAATTAEAQGRRPDSLALSCGEARALVRAHGAVVMSTGGPDIYDRFVR
jgi:hypothetical protein